MKPHQKNGSILLLETPFLSQTGTKEVQAYVQSKYNLALLSLGSYIRQNSHLPVRLVNMVKDRLSIAQLLKSLHHDPPAVIGISLYSYSLSLAYKIASTIKSQLRQVHISVGGPHAEIYPRETIALAPFDSIVLGDGEIPFFELCNQVIRTGVLDENHLPQGVYTKKTARLTSTLIPYYIDNLNRLPIPDLSLLGNHTRYRDFLSNKVMGLICSSRGCPNRCHYCRSEKSRYRSFSIEYIMDVLRYYKTMGVEYVEFWDETFNPSRGRLEKFAQAMLAADLGITWAIRGAVVNHISHATMVKLKKTGLRLIQFGVETSSPKMLRYLNKRIDCDKVTRAFDICRALKIRTVANMMINIPGQSKQEILDDLRFIRKIKPDYISVSIYNWAPGTTLYEDSLKRGGLAFDHWKKFALSPVGEEPLVHAVNETRVEDIYRLRSAFVFRFYFHPTYILNYLKTIESDEIRRTVSIAYMMLQAAASGWMSQFRRNA